ncbi:endonuclease/exonuclease/phosphatase family protein [Streptomyces sp. NPDC088789]|uniref:endonuclease/exonuclease/phosphatase family protein n=1 Tax=Streptomyces sp. NPDC088789 TaxID=3365899 RepID=UPI00381E6E3B
MGEMTHSQWRPADPDATEEELAEAEREKEAANRRFGAAMTLLEARGYRAPKGQGNNPTGLFFRESTFEYVSRHPRVGVGRTPPTNVVLRLRNGPRREIATEAFHDSFCSRHTREEEADTRTALADKVKVKLGRDPENRGKALICMGDTNGYPMPAGEVIPPVDWDSEAITDHSHRWHRAAKQPDGSWASHTYLDEAMSECRMWDPARYAARKHGQINALDPTSGHGPNAVGQGGPQRIIRGYTDPWVVQAILEVNVIKMHGITDHHLLEYVMSYRKFCEALERSFEPMPSWMSVAHSSARWAPAA